MLYMAIKAAFVRCDGSSYSMRSGRCKRSRPRRVAAAANACPPECLPAVRTCQRDRDRSYFRVCGAGDVGESEFVGVVDDDKLWGVHESPSRGPGRGRASAARPLLIPLYYIRMKGQNGP